MSSDDNYGIPREFLRADLLDFRFYDERAAAKLYAPIKDGIHSFLRGNFQSLYLFGHNGSGKSHVACAILNRLHRFGIGVRATSVFDLFEEYRTNQWSFPPAYLECAVLLIEELGKTYVAKNDMVTPAVERLIKTRFESGKRVLFTANCKVDDLEPIHGPTIVSMIKGKAMPLKFPDIDWRVRLNLEKIRGVTNGTK
jgi:DNA replication protein DnaC